MTFCSLTLLHWNGITSLTPLEHHKLLAFYGFFLMFFMIFMPFCGALEQYKSAGKFIFDIHKKQSLKGYLLKNENKKVRSKVVYFFDC